MLYHLWLNWKVGFSQKLTNRETTIILVKMNAVCSLGQFFISLFPLQEHILWLPITWTPEIFKALIRGSSICFHCISENRMFQFYCISFDMAMAQPTLSFFRSVWQVSGTRSNWGSDADYCCWLPLIFTESGHFWGQLVTQNVGQPITLRLSVTPLLPLWSFHFLHYYVFPALLSGVLSPLEIYLSTFQFLAADACYLWMVLLSLFISYMNAYSVSLHVQSPNLDPQTWLQTA